MHNIHNTLKHIKRFLIISLNLITSFRVATTLDIENKGR